MSHGNHRNHRKYPVLPATLLSALPAPPLGIPKGDACYQRDARRGGDGGGVCIYFTGKILQFPYTPPRPSGTPPLRGVGSIIKEP